MDLTNRDLMRYGRQMNIPGLGRRGQKKLKNAHVAVAGVGGLGSAACTYLAAAGVGHISLIDDDVVELSNLNRQILFAEKDIGRSKVQSAAERLVQINKCIEINCVNKRIEAGNAQELLKNADAVVDCMDNFYTRYILNEAALALGIPFFHGACSGFEGRATTIIPKKTPCLRCIIPKSPPEKKAPVLGTTSGIIGCLQATEVIKFFAGIEPLLVNNLLIYDSRFLKYELIKIERNPRCPCCGA